MRSGRAAGSRSPSRRAGPRTGRPPRRATATASAAADRVAGDRHRDRDRHRHADAARPGAADRRHRAVGAVGDRVPARRRRAGRRAHDRADPADRRRRRQAADGHDACRACAAAGEGGLLGLAVSPRYARDRLVYAYFTSASDNRIVRFKLGGAVRTVADRAAEGRASTTAGGSRSGPTASSTRASATRATPPTRRTADRSTARSCAWTRTAACRRATRSRLARVVAGATATSRGWRGTARERLWASEFGQNTRDEVNLIRRGRNYGWPDVEGVGRHAGRPLHQPAVTWATSEASPSGAAIIGSHLYVAALQGECVWRIPLRGASLGKPTRMLAGPLRAHPDRRGGARRHAVGRDVQPRRARLAALGRRPDHRHPCLNGRQFGRMLLTVGAGSVALCRSSRRRPGARRAVGRAGGRSPQAPPRRWATADPLAAADGGQPGRRPRDRARADPARRRAARRRAQRRHGQRRRRRASRSWRARRSRPRRQPASATGSQVQARWPDKVAPAAGTKIDESTGAVTLDAKQPGGSMKAKAENEAPHGPTRRSS